LLVAMVVVLLIMGATLSALQQAYRAHETAREITGLSNNLRIGVDLMVRDLIQVGQGLPTGRVVQVPAGAGVLDFNRPGPVGSPCTTWPAGTTELSAVSVGPGCGPAVNGVATDTLTTLAGDTAFDHVPLATGASGIDVAARTLTVSLPGADPTGTLPLIDPRGVDISNGGADDIRVGDLLMLTKGTFSTLLYVTAVDGAQTVTVAGGDPMNLNQFDDTLAWSGTLDQLDAAAPPGGSGTEVTRIRMITYYVDATIDPNNPRLVRHMNWGDPNAAQAQRGRTVAFGIENLQLSYDLVDGVTNPSSVRMVAADLAGAGACAPNPCSPNQVRKVNVFLEGRSAAQLLATNRFLRNSLATQVSLRSLALVDRYR
jgi:hypothetical protein